MIKYILKCNNNHEFKSWFSDSSEFEKLNKKRLLECIYCSSNKIQKSIMAPMISNNKSIDANTNSFDQELMKEKKKLTKLRKYVEKNFEFIEKDFSKKVREIYYDSKTKKNIYGIASTEEKEELADEGIDLVTIPWVRKDN